MTLHDRYSSHTEQNVPDRGFVQDKSGLNYNCTCYSNKGDRFCTIYDIYRKEIIRLIISDVNYDTAR